MRLKEKSLMLSEHEDMKKADALRRMNRTCKVGVLDNWNTHFSNINHTEPVWWFHIPLKKIVGPDAEKSLQMVCYDRRSYKLSHLNVPTFYFKGHLKPPHKLQIFESRQVIQLELSNKMVNLFEDRGSGCRFAQFLCCELTCEHS
jgi:hypothetical protein